MSEGKKTVSAEELKRVYNRLASFGPGRNLSLTSEVTNIVKNIKAQDPKKKSTPGFTIQKPKKISQGESSGVVVKKETKSEKKPSKFKLRDRKPAKTIQSEGTLFGQGFKVEPGTRKFSSQPGESSGFSTRGSTSKSSSAKTRDDYEPTIQDEDIDWKAYLDNNEQQEEDEEYLNQDQPFVLTSNSEDGRRAVPGIDKLREILDEVRLRGPIDSSYGHSEPVQHSKLKNVTRPDEVIKPDNKNIFKLTLPMDLPFKSTKEKSEEEKSKGHVIEDLESGPIGKMVVRKSGRVEMHLGDFVLIAHPNGKVHSKTLLVQRSKGDAGEKMVEIGEVKQRVAFRADLEGLMEVKPPAAYITLPLKKE